MWRTVLEAMLAVGVAITLFAAGLVAWQEIMTWWIGWVYQALQAMQ